MMSREKAFRFGAVYLGEPSDPSKGSTCVYLMGDFKIPDLDDLRKDEVLYFGVWQTENQYTDMYFVSSFVHYICICLRDLPGHRTIAENSGERLRATSKQRRGCTKCASGLTMTM